MFESSVVVTWPYCPDFFVLNFFVFVLVLFFVLLHMLKFILSYNKINTFYVFKTKENRKAKRHLDK